MNISMKGWGWCSLARYSLVEEKVRKPGMH